MSDRFVYQWEFNSKQLCRQKSDTTQSEIFHVEWNRDDAYLRKLDFRLLVKSNLHIPSQQNKIWLFLTCSNMSSVSVSTLKMRCLLKCEGQTKNMECEFVKEETSSNGDHQMIGCKFKLKHCFFKKKGKMIRCGVNIASIEMVYDINAINLQKQRQIDELRRELMEKNKENKALIAEKQKIENEKKQKIKENMRLIQEKNECELAQKQKEYELNEYMKEIKRMKVKQTKMENHIKQKQNALILKKQSLKKKKKKNKELMKIIKQSDYEKKECFNNLKEQIAKNKEEMEKEEQLFNDLRIQIENEQIKKQKIESEKNEILKNSEIYKRKINEKIKMLEGKIAAKNEEYKSEIFELRNKALCVEEEIISDYVAIENEDFVIV